MTDVSYVGSKMGLTKFLNLCAILLGAMAVLSLSKALFASAEQILRATYHYSSIGWPSVAIISDKAGHKSDILASVIFAILVLLFQMCSLFIEEDVSFTSAKINGIALGIVFVSIIAVIVYLIDVGAKKSFELDIKKLAAKDYIQSCFEERSCPLFADVESIAEAYFKFCKGSNENNPDFVKRFANFLGYHIPKDADFSKFR